MTVRRVLIIPQVIRLAVRAPRDVRSRWDRYWAATTATGDSGDVLWDSSDPAEVARYAELLAAHADPELPILDLGCGNGRFTRELAERFGRAIGVDVSPAAVDRARTEAAAAGSTAEFRVGDITDPAVGTYLRAELGPCTVFVRGVLHVLPAREARRVAVNVATLAGPGGITLLAETDYPGPLLGYLESLGASPRGMPGPLARALSAGLPRPHRFGPAELDAAFPPDRWERLADDESAQIRTVPMQVPGVPGLIPGHLVVLRLRS